jgi:hypothetical protein
MRTPTHLHAVTIVKNGMPWIKHHLPMLEKSGVPFTWHVSEGASDNINCTSWCRKPEPGLSTDGTKEYLDSISRHPNVRLYRKDLWAGKIEQINAFAGAISGPSIVAQIDADELYTSQQIAKIMELFRTRPDVSYMRFWCDYFICEGIVTTNPDGYGNRRNLEWTRFWRADRGYRFTSHEPAVFRGNRGKCMERDETLKHGIRFQHMAYATEASVAAKEYFYNYPGALAQWRALRDNKQWPCRNVGNFLSWVGEGVTAEPFKGEIIRV